MSSSIPELKFTPVAAIPSIASKIRAGFNAQTTKSLDYRIKQLRKLYWAIADNEPAIVEATKRDLGKSRYETYMTEIDWCKNDIIFVCNNLKKWAKDEPAPDMDLTNKFVSPKIRKDPLGAVLIIGTYNFPFQLSVGPLIGAIAGGNTAVVKPSENAPATAAVIERVMNAALDPSCFACVQGAIPETTALLDEKWDKIFYTGSANVGKIIAKKAAETLTPVVLELGGKNPAIITKNADLRTAARRMLWGKVFNAGQVCISQNYHLIEEEVVPGFLGELEKCLKEFYPDGAKASPDYGRIVNDRQWQRLKKMINDSKGKILMGGTMDEKEKFLEPTVVQVDDINDILIQEESFGPIITIFSVKSLDQAIRIANEVQPTPLGAYPFGNRAETDRVLKELRSGGASVNDAYFHGSMPTMPFGGVGESGYGNYRGRASFDCFTHRRSIVSTPRWLEAMMGVRYPPYDTKKFDEMRKMMVKKPNFDREGNDKMGFLTFLVTLGAGSASGGLTRYAILALAAAVLKQYLDRRVKL